MSPIPMGMKKKENSCRREKNFTPTIGLELTTPRFRVWHSTNWANQTMLKALVMTIDRINHNIFITIFIFMVMTIAVSIAWLAQLVERQTHVLERVSSSPAVVVVKCFFSCERVFLFLFPWIFSKYYLLLCKIVVFLLRNREIFNLCLNIFDSWRFVKFTFHNRV